jgi:hypothetical protein
MDMTPTPAGDFDRGPAGASSLPSSARVVELFRHRPGDADHRGTANVTRSPWCRSRPKGRSSARSLHRRTSGPQLPEPSASTIDGIGPAFATRKRRTSPGSDCRQRPPPHPINRVALSIGSGAAFRRNRWPHRLGFRIGVPVPRRAAPKPTPHHAAHIYRRQPPIVIQRATTILLERSRITSERRYPLLPAVICRGKPESVVGGRP